MGVGGREWLKGKRTYNWRGRGCDGDGGGNFESWLTLYGLWTLKWGDHPHPQSDWDWSKRANGQKWVIIALAQEKLTTTTKYK